jgi:uncharacterized protein (TIGR00299 family) protein
MKIGHLECFSGAAGDMLVASAVAAGAPFEEIEAELRRLAVPGLRVEAPELLRGGISARAFRVEAEDDPPHRGLREVLEIVRRAKFAAAVEERVVACFRLLAEAEAGVHGCSVDQVHFHEVGAVDAIADICAAVVGFELLGIESLSCAEVVTGFGTVRCAHGELPVPAPATARLLEGVPTRSGELRGEFCTPTGAALLRTLVDEWRPAPPMRGLASGFGAGSKDSPGRPNVLRLRIGETIPESRGELAGEASRGAEQIYELRLQVDNCSGEVLGHALDRALEEGALDVIVLPGLTKKSRPAQLVIALVEESSRSRVEELLLSEIPSLGLRRVPCARSTLERRVELRPSPFGELRFKVRRLPDGTELAHPEADDVARVARECGLPVPVVLDRIARGEA